jgi:hypothetical protein
MLTVPGPSMNLSQKRQWIMDQATTPYVMMLDDDLAFSVRGGHGVKLRRAIPEDVDKMLRLLLGWLVEDGFAHVGVSARAGNNRIPTEWKDISRMTGAYAFSKAELCRVGARFDRIPLMQDFDVTLTMLRAGLPNRVTYKYAYNQRGSNAEGGCSTYRTPELMRQAAERLVALHEPFVRVVEKRTKTSWQGMPRDKDGYTVRADVKVQWQKAFKG